MEDSAHGSDAFSSRTVNKSMRIEARAEDGAPLDPPLAQEDSIWSQHEPVTAIDPQDVATPDNWVPRHPVSPYSPG